MHVTTTKCALIFKHVFILLKNILAQPSNQKISWLRDGRKNIYLLRVNLKKKILPPKTLIAPPCPPPLAVLYTDSNKQKHM